MYDFQERNRTAFHLTGSQLRCSISPFPSFILHILGHIFWLYFFFIIIILVISITLWSFSVVMLEPGQYWMFWSVLLTRIGEMRGKKPGASLTPRSPCFRPRTRLDISLRHYPSTPANSHLLHNVQTFHVFKPSHGKKAKDYICSYLKKEGKKKEKRIRATPCLNA